MRLNGTRASVAVPAPAPVDSFELNDAIAAARAADPLE